MLPLHPGHLQWKSIGKKKPLISRKTCSTRHKIWRSKWRSNSERVYIPVKLHYLTEHLRHSRRHSVGCPPDFEGACLDIGSSRSLIGLNQARAYCRAFGIALQLSSSQTTFRFGTYPTRSVGRLKVLIPTPPGMLKVYVDVVPEDVPLLIGLDTMFSQSLEPLVIDMKLQGVRHNWTTLIELRHGHLYLYWKPKLMTFFYTTRQLEQLHRHLIHPSSRKPYELLRRAEPQKMSADTLSIMQEISKSCETCTLYSPRQIAFQIRSTEEIKFNQKLILDIMFLKDRKNRSRPVLHIIDAGTRFSSAAFLKSSSTNTVWDTFVKIWSSMYVVFPESLLTDQGSVFLSKEWAYNCESSEIKLHHTGTESHNSLGIGEKYHSNLRTIYQKVCCDHRNIPEDVALAKSVQAMNETVGPLGLVPSLLVFGVLPKLLSVSLREFPNQRDRLRAAATARTEYERIISSMQVQGGIRSIPPPAADRKYSTGEFAYVYREELKHYTGPHLIASVEDKCVRLHVGERTGPRSFKVSQLRPAPVTRHPIYDEQVMELDDGPPTDLHTEVQHPRDPRAGLFDDAKRKEILELVERGTFMLVLEEEAGQNLNLIPSIYVLAINHSGDSSTVYKARLVLGGHRDKENRSVVHNTYNLKQ